MASYKIEWKPSARKEFESLPRQVIARLFNAIADLANNPHPGGARKLVGSEQAYRIRIGDYRVLYWVHGDQLMVEIIRVKHRKDVYKR
jgi:mRNA interferase RelE/StbE